jgi:hypothetical protein
MMTKANISFLSSVLLVLGVGAAHAGPKWDVIGSGCVPSEDSPAYDMAGNRVEFQGTETGDIHLTCPITVDDGSLLSYFELEYDDDGGAAYYVQATLKYFEGAASTDVCTVSSNLSSYDTNTCDFTNFTVDTDIAHLYMYIRLHRDAGATTYNPKFYGIRLY